jgi:hypothetical protein
MGHKLQFRGDTEGKRYLETIKAGQGVGVMIGDY